MYPIWAASLVLAAGCTNAASACELDDNKQWARNLLETFQYVFYGVMIASLLDPDSSSIMGSLQSVAVKLVLLLVATLLQSKAFHCLVVAKGDSDRRVAELIKEYVNAPFFSLFLVRTIIVVLIGVDVLRNSLSVNTATPIIQVHDKYTERIITLSILCTILAIEILQAVFYVASDWFKVSIACMYVRPSRCFHVYDCIEKIMIYLVRFTIFRHWKNRIDQYSIISDSSVDGVSWFNKVKRAIFGSPDDDATMLKTVKRAIVGYLRLCEGKLSNGEESLRKNGVLTTFAWALEGNRSQVEIMLMWIIATEYCNIAPTNTDDMNAAYTEFREVSVCLSRYCAYLMHSAPELLPGYFGDTKYSLLIVKDKISDVRPAPDAPAGINWKYHALMNLKVDQKEWRQEEYIIFSRGLMLGRKLQSRLGSALRWKVMADFWAEKILYIAPSDNVKGHMEHLAKGGEFLTHIWALLTHAGIVKINREHGQSATPSRPPSHENVERDQSTTTPSQLSQ